MPIRIDGNEVSGVTLDNQDVSEVTVDGDVVFTAGPTIIDDFEDGNLNEYVSDVNSFSVTQSNPISGNNSLQIPNSGGRNIASNTLPNIPSEGDSFSVKFRADNWSNGQLYITFGCTSDFVPFTRGSGNYIRFGDEFNSFDIGEDPGSRSQDNFSYTNGANYRCEVDYGVNTLSAELFENGNSVATNSFNRTNFINNSHIGVARLNRISFTALVDDFILLD